MAITIASAGNAVGSLKVRYQDKFRKEKTENYPVDPAAVQADIEALLSALDNASNAVLCEVWWNDVEYDLTGEKVTAGTADFNSVTELDNITFFSVSNCHDEMTVKVPAPKAVMFSGIEERVNDTTNGTFTTMTNAFSAVLYDPNTGLADFAVEGGIRTQQALKKPTGL